MPQTPEYVLWLPSWYPNKLDPFDGDFIQRHAQAASLYTPIHVFFLVKDEQKQVTDSVKVEERVEGNLKETIIYYSGSSFLFSFSNRIHSFRQYRKLYRLHIAKLFEQRGFPSLVHVHIAFKAGMIAQWIEKRYRIPYLLTEQWTIYLPEAKPNLDSMPRITRYLVSKIVAGAKLLLPVSKYLGDAMKKRWPQIPQEVVPNVVNTDIFKEGEVHRSPTVRLVHISTLSYQKDPGSLMDAVLLLKKQDVDFELHIFGPRKQEIETFIINNHLEKQVIPHGEVTQPVLASAIRESDALILYSRYETFGCVIIEANACGKPVIVPDTPLMMEIVREGQNAVLAEPGSSSSLARAILKFAGNKNQFDPSLIGASTREKYSYTIVGQQLAGIYSRYSI